MHTTTILAAASIVASAFAQYDSTAFRIFDDYDCTGHGRFIIAQHCTTLPKSAQSLRAPEYGIGVTYCTGKVRYVQSEQCASYEPYKPWGSVRMEVV
ncbi:hypothetical protein MHUMG1_10437 [Metarhizium humberi]|uniref:Uncharacterized protein n=1 Tax=Metarhizium humberi TaxID=2596975 RepID=A0A9P8S2P6_9HYPO|nr:hypothetical protein MHUMG1_10437 [Metarhizium humberi]